MSTIVIRIIVVLYLWVLLRDFSSPIALTEFEQLVEERCILARTAQRAACS